MSFTNTDIFSGVSGNDIFGGGGYSTAGTTSNPNNISWSDKIFGTAADFGTQYLNILGQGTLNNQRMKYAAQNQSNLIGYTEVPQNVGATPAAQFTPAAQSISGGINKNMLLIGAAVVAALVLIK